MRVLVHLDIERRISRSGIHTAWAQHRRALSERDDITLVGDGVGPIDQLRWLISRRPPDLDVIHTHLFGPSSLVLAAVARRHGIPLVCHAHVTREDFRDSFRGSNVAAHPLGWYLRAWYNRADLVVVPSEYTRRRLKEYPVTVPIEVVTNGVDLDSLAGYEALREPYRERFDLDGTVVCALGNVFARKGVSTFCAVARRCPDLDFVWFGPYYTGLTGSPTVKRAVAEAPDNVTFTGWVEDKRGALAAGDIFFLPSHEENQGIAVLEAMACGLPVVLRDLPVFREFVTDGRDGLLADDPDGFEAAVRTIADDPTARTEFGATARRTANDHRLEVVGESLAQCYRSLTGQ